MGIPVKLQAFEGPLDLLLHLIDKHKIDIYDIPVSLITDQYLEYIQQMREQKMEIASEFLVMAATLLELKSRMLLPKEEKPDEEEEETDPREELVKRLLEYKMVRYQADELRDRSVEASRNLYREQQLPEEVKTYEPPIDYEKLIGKATIESLEKTFQEVLRRQRNRVDTVRSGFGKIEREEYDVVGRERYIRERIAKADNLSFRALLEEQPGKEEIIVTFLVVLDMAKSGEIHLIQDDNFGEILIRPGMITPEEILRQQGLRPQKAGDADTEKEGEKESETPVIEEESEISEGEEKTKTSIIEEDSPEVTEIPEEYDSYATMSSAAGLAHKVYIRLSTESVNKEVESDASVSDQRIVQQDPIDRLLTEPACSEENDHNAVPEEPEPADFDELNLAGPEEIEAAEPAEIEAAGPEEIEAAEPAEIEAAEPEEIEAAGPAEIEASGPAEIEAAEPEEIEAAEPAEIKDTKSVESKEAESEDSLDSDKELSDKELSDKEFSDKELWKKETSQQPLRRFYLQWAIRWRSARSRKRWRLKKTGPGRQWNHLTRDTGRTEAACRSIAMMTRYKVPKKQVLTNALLETLSIIAYKQPATRMDVEHVRGVNSDHAINKLVAYDLVEEVGRKEAPGRPLLFGTTEQFLRTFGIESLDELPETDAVKMEEFRQEAEEEAGTRLDI